MLRLDGLREVAVLMGRDVGSARVEEAKDPTDVTARARIPEVSSNRSTNVLSERDAQFRGAPFGPTVVLGLQCDLGSHHHGGYIIVACLPQATAASYYPTADSRYDGIQELAEAEAYERDPLRSRMVEGDKLRDALGIAEAFSQ